MRKIIIFSTLFFLTDLFSKIIIKNNLILNDSLTVIDDFFFLTYTNNYGAAFSIFQNERLFLVIVSLLALVFLLVYLIKSNVKRKLEIVGYSMLLGGILGNLYDRIVYGYVIDFLDFRLFEYNFAIFNLADSFIVVSIIILIIDVVWSDKRCK